MANINRPLVRSVFAHLKLREWISKRIATAALICACAAPVQAQVLVVSNDMGGSVQSRLQTIAALRSTSTRVEIRGQCASSCTMFLGLPNACVDPNSRLGFHGPQSQYYGISLPPDQFEYWSQVMASNYPGPIANWFMADARRTTMGLVTISGREAIRMGARSC